jgi:hypothetical protein
MKLWLLPPLLALACNPVPGPVPPDDASDASPAPVVDAGAEDAETDAGEQDAGGLDDCGRAGATLERLQCRDSAGAALWLTPEGVTFAEACRYAFADGRDWHAECLATIRACDEVGAAYRGELCRP